MSRVNSSRRSHEPQDRTRRTLRHLGNDAQFLRVCSPIVVEPVHTRQICIAIAQMVVAELTASVAERLQQFGDGRVFRVQSDLGARHADFGQAGADRVLPVMKLARPAVQLCWRTNP
jgi:hypothetical protein